MTFTIVFTSMLMFLGLLQEVETRFDDLGKLLLGGVATAIVFAVTFSFVRLKLRDRNPPKSDFITISATDDKN